MSFSKVILSLISVALISGCGMKKSSISEKVIVDAPLVAKLKTASFYASQNEDGTYSTFKGSWTVPEYVKSVKIIGCSGGNGGGGGGAGGGGGRFYEGNWSNDSQGGNGSSGGDANEIIGSGEAGGKGEYGKLNGLSIHFRNRDYPQAPSANQAGGKGGVGEQTFFGNFAFKSASLNSQNIDNSVKLTSSYDIHNVCLGGLGGDGGFGGHGSHERFGKTNFEGGKGGQGGKGKNGFHSIVEEFIIDVTPGQTIAIQVGKGGRGGDRSHEIVRGQEGGPERANGHSGNQGKDGKSGKPGVLFIQWIGL
jgi:hypothetical protein